MDAEDSNDGGTVGSEPTVPEGRTKPDRDYRDRPKSIGDVLFRLLEGYLYLDRAKEDSSKGRLGCILSAAFGVGANTVLVGSIAVLNFKFEVLPKRLEVIKEMGGSDALLRFSRLFELVSSPWSSVLLWLMWIAALTAIICSSVKNGRPIRFFLIGMTLSGLSVTIAAIASGRFLP